MFSVAFFSVQTLVNGQNIVRISFLFFLLLMYTANNIPYGALMAVMSSDDKERVSIGSYRMVAFGEDSSGNTLFLVLFRKCRSFNRDVKIENKTQVNIALQEMWIM
jgi:GPH family glycoside/pentoside/hexuronide:cation symporter